MLRNAMRVLGLFSPRRPELGVLEVAELLGEPKSNASRWLSAMTAAGFLDRDDATRRYRVALVLAAIGETARQSTSLQRLARRQLERLSAATGETADLVVLVGQEAVTVDAVVSPRPIMHVGWVGRRLPLHATAAGKALLAWRTEGEVARLLPRDLERFPAATIVERGALLGELATVRRQGWSVAYGELSDDIVGVAAPVRDHRGTVVAVLAIGAPASRVPRTAILATADHVRSAADELSTALGHRGPADAFADTTAHTGADDGVSVRAPRARR
jgi:DNA-binding IclR family transcriptional regulator